MVDSASAALAMLQRQMQELDALVADAAQGNDGELGLQRLARWKVRSQQLIEQHLPAGEVEAARQFFAVLRAGNGSRVVELRDHVNAYRGYLAALA